VIGIDPGVGGKCPGDHQIDNGYNGEPHCTRNLDDAGNRAATFELTHDVGSIDIDMMYHQYYSADSFNGDTSSTTVDDDVYCEGVTITSIDSSGTRRHIYTASVGYSADTDYEDYNCPARNCNMDDTSHCVGPIAPAWMGDAFSCNSGAVGGVSDEWYGGMEAKYTAAVRLSAGDLIEVRLMADQATSNEDVGLSYLNMVLDPTPGYPYGSSDGWVEFEEPTDSTSVIGIDPSISGACPGSFSLANGFDQRAICWRNLDDAGTVSASIDVGHDVGTIDVDMEYNQFYSADGFNSASGKDINDEYFMEGVSIAAVDTNDDRSHIASFAVGIAYDESYTSYNCPLHGCGYDDQQYCDGPNALPWMGDQIYCSSGNSGDWESVWYATMKPDVMKVATSIAEGDAIEVRAMADQASDNEDVGITQLKLSLNTEQTYPMDNGLGWVVFEEPTDSRTVIGIDPGVGGKCPGDHQIDNGYNGEPICTRNLDDAGNRAASFTLAHDASSITIDMTYHQHYSADAFNGDSDASINDDVWMEGVAIAKLGADGGRTHIFGASVGISYDTEYTSYNCPSDNCGYDNQDYCVGPDPPSFVGSDFWCDSGNSGDWDAMWYAAMKIPTWQIDMDLTAGDEIEIRIMADQESSNEDCGVTLLQMTFE
jgi:hypothetical protein